MCYEITYEVFSTIESFVYTSQKNMSIANIIEKKEQMYLEYMNTGEIIFKL